MIRRVIFLFCMVSLAATATGQSTTPVKDPKKNYRYNNYFEVSGLVGKDNYGGIASWSHVHGFGKKKKRFKIGYGIRVTSYFGFNQNYVTAPAKLTSGFSGPLVIFSDNITQNFDTVFFNRPQTNSINAYLILQYTFFNRWDLGVNIDLFGVSFGTKKIGQYSSAQNPPGLFPIAQDAYPTGFNVFLTSDNNLGSLTSEVYLRFWITNQWAVKAAFVYANSEYTTVNQLRLDNDRFRLKMMMGSLGVTFCPWRSEIFKSSQ